MGSYSMVEHSLSTIFKPIYLPSPSPETPETPAIQSLIKALSLEEHLEGGYFAQTDTNSITIPSPYPLEPLSQRTVTLAGRRDGYDPNTRQLSTVIFYYLTPNRPRGFFHRNRSRIIHTLHRGRGRYVLLHPSGRVETFIVGQNVLKGEKLQWCVEGGVYKASFLLAEEEDRRVGENGGLLISEVVVPGFEFDDHEFLSKTKASELLSKEYLRQLNWLIREDDDEEDLVQTKKATNLIGINGIPRKQRQRQQQQL